MPRPKVWILANQDGTSHQNSMTAFTVGNLGFFQVQLHAFWAVQCNSYISEVNAKLPQGAESNILPHLPWWHSHFLHRQLENIFIICGLFLTNLESYNLKLKPSKCSFFQKRNHLSGTLSLKGWGCNPVTWTWKQSQNVHCCKLTQRCMPFLVWWVHYRRFIKGFAHIAQPLSEYLAREGASRKSEWVSLIEDALKAFKALKQAYMAAPILAFADYTKPFLLETDVSKDGLGAVLLQKQADGWYHPIAYGSRTFTPHEKNYHSTKLEFLALKWAVTEHFKEYLPYQSFLVRTDNNPLTYIMSTPNLDAMGHWWVSALAWFNFELEYQKGCDNTVADVLSQVTTQLDPDTVRSVLNGVTLGTVHWAEVHDPAIVEGDHCLEQEIHVAAGHTLVQMLVTDWAEAQKKDPMLSAVLDWLKAQKKTDLKALLAEHTSSEEGRLILLNWQNFMIHQGALYLCSTPKGETKDLLLFMVPRAHCVATLNGCHWDVGHQGCDHILSLLSGAFLVARYDQSDVAVYQVLHALLAAWEQFVQSAPTPRLWPPL